MTKDEMKDKISMALKDPVLQQGFEIICKNLAELEKENTELKEKLEIEQNARGDWFGKAVTKDNQLTKAKELIKKFSEFVNNEVELDSEHPQEHTNLWNELCEKAEQFLKEVTE